MIYYQTKKFSRKLHLTTIMPLKREARNKRYNPTLNAKIVLQITVKSTKKRKRNIIWLNPPYSMNVKTNIVRKFLQLIDKHFPNITNYIKYLTEIM